MVILLLICTCTYVRAAAPVLIDRNRKGCVAADKHHKHLLQGCTHWCVATNQANVYHHTAPLRV